MESDYPITYQESPTREEEAHLTGELNREAIAAKGVSPIRHFALLCRRADGALIGGATGVSLFGALYIDTLWVDPSLRGSGLGTRLIEGCEKIARERGCTFLYLQTMDWQALPFYQKVGYQIEFARHGFEKDSTMYLMRKGLDPDPMGLV
ncbi:MAG: GNAT family N-acetyltransferase [Parachlamydiales bacterium]